MKKDMTVLHVNTEGQVVAAKGVGTRKQELEKLRLQQVNAQKLQLQEVASQLLADGPDAVADQLQPVLKVKRPSPPKKRNATVKERLQKIVDDMPCFKPGPSKTLLYKEKSIYCDSGKLSVARLKYRLRPDALHRALLKLLIPEKVLRLDGVSATGTRGCVGINPIITETVVLYVSAVYTAAKGNLEDIKYDPTAILKNLLTNTRKEKGVWRILDEASNDDEEMEVDLMSSEAADADAGEFSGGKQSTSAVLSEVTQAVMSSHIPPPPALCLTLLMTVMLPRFSPHLPGLPLLHLPLLVLVNHRLEAAGWLLHQLRTIPTLHRNLKIFHLTDLQRMK